MSADNVIKEKTIWVFMDMKTKMKLNWKVVKMAKRFVDVMLAELTKRAEEYAHHRGKEKIVIMDRDLILALNSMGYDQFVRNYSILDGGENVDNGKEIPSGRYSVKKEYTR